MLPVMPTAFLYTFANEFYVGKETHKTDREIGNIIVSEKEMEARRRPWTP
jgi:hypothetical protein